MDKVEVSVGTLAVSRINMNRKQGLRWGGPEGKSIRTSWTQIRNR